MSERLVERMARAIAEHIPLSPEGVTERHRDAARAAYQALKAPNTRMWRKYTLRCDLHSALACNVCFPKEGE